MRFSLEWLREHAALDAPTDRLAAILVDTGTEVNEVLRVADGAVVARVLTLTPVAERTRKPLTVATIDAGRRGQVTLVTAATNLHVGDLVPWGPPGTLLPGWDEPLGVRAMLGGKYESPGMLLSVEELGLGTQADGIMVLERGRPGQPVHEVLPLDSVLDVEVTTNRPDCLCHVGIARELAAALAEPLREPATTVPDALLSATSLEGRLRVRIEDPAGCPRFTARIIENVRVGPSPEWMRRRLAAVGLRPINNVVDVTNYVAAELGQPLHAFDLDRLREQSPGLADGAPAEVVVRRARAGERVLGLDGREHTLGGDDLAVCAGERAVSIGGVIGGDSTAVHAGTRTVLLEAANWNPATIRATSRRLGVRTDASGRFEKGLPDALPPQALERAAALIAELGEGHVLRGRADEHPAPLPALGEIRVPTRTLDAVLGYHVDPSEAATALARLAFTVAQEQGMLTVVPPTFRRDVHLAVDVIEEVGRSLGYGRVPATLPGRRVEVTSGAPPDDIEDAVREVLCGAGFDEAITYSFVSAPAATRLPGAGEGRAPIPLRNPLSEDWSVMRTSLLPGLCGALATNVSRGLGEVAVFEIGRAFWEGERRGPVPGSTADGADDALPPLPLEPRLLAVVSQADDMDAQSAAGRLRLLQSVLAWLGHELGGVTVSVDLAPVAGCRDGRGGRVLAGGRPVGVIGELTAPVVEAFGIRGRVAAAEVRLDELVPQPPPAPRFAPPPRLPAVVQDLAVVVADDRRAGEALGIARDAGGELLESVELRDEYRSDRIGEGRKSWTFHLVFRAPDRTLTSLEAQRVQGAIAAALVERIGAEVRR